jgi:hypothetical protein
MFKNKAAGVAIGLPIAVALTFTTGCLPEDSGSGTQGRASGAANGIDKVQPTQAFARASQATLAARTVRMRAQVTDEESGGAIKLDMNYAGRNRTKGTMQMGAQKLELIRVGSVVYVKGNRAFYRDVAGQEAANALVGKYIKATKNSPDFSDLYEFTTLADLMKQFQGAGQGWKFGSRGHIGGRPSVAIEGAGEQIHLATQGPPYVLRATAPGKGSFDFLSYNTRVAIKPPPANLVIDIGG